MLLMPLRDEAILQRRHELKRVQRKHKALLRAILQTTLEINHFKHPQTYDLTSFLDEHDISRGRPFDPSSLPPTDDLLDSINERVPGSSETYHGPTRPKDTVRFGQEGLPEAQGNGAVFEGEQGLKPRSGPTPLLVNGLPPWPTAERLSGNQVQKSKPLGGSSLFEVGAASRTSLGSAQESGLPPDHANIVPSPEHTADQQLDNADAVRLPTIETQEKSLEPQAQGRNDGHAYNMSQGAKTQGKPLNLTPPISEEDTELGTGKVVERRGEEYDQSRPSEVLNSGMNTSQIEASGEVPSTPDGQLRSEEARSIQVSASSANLNLNDPGSTPPPAGISSAYLDGNVVEGHEVDDIPNSNDELNAKQADSIEHIAPRQGNLFTKAPLGLKDEIFPGMNGDSSRNLTLSRRPPMRIDTQVVPPSDVSTTVAAKSHNMPMPTPTETMPSSKPAPVVGDVQSIPERMTTRVSSGALRHKSVSEILGETPKATPTQAEKSAVARDSAELQGEEQNSLQTPNSVSPFTSPDPATFKRRLSELSERKRSSKLSTVVFAGSRNSEVTQAQDFEQDELLKKDRDYMLTLFNFQIASPPRAQPLNKLIKTAHKTLTTADHLTDIMERQACHMLNKIYALQARNCWSLRQTERSVEPTRPVTHQDVLLSEMKWMKTDFKEERKWKISAAKFTADVCAMWVASDPIERRSLQVRVRAKPPEENAASEPMSTPDLVHSTDGEYSEATDDETLRDPGNAPATIFSLPPEMFIFGLSQSPMAEKLLAELPLYEPGSEMRSAALSGSGLQPDAFWKKDLVPISKYAHGKIVSMSEYAPGIHVNLDDGPPRKRSRFDYYHMDLQGFKTGPSPDLEPEEALDPDQKDVALFDPEYRHIRDRIHNGHAFRPPSEFIMPTQGFFESRLSSQWTLAEDDELRRIVKAYSYNWSLISSSMTLPSLFASGPERRTPWECFERWIGLEGLPVEMAKINYFRQYYARLQNAQKALEDHTLAQQQPLGGNPAHLPMRKRTTQPYTVERRKSQKHIHLIDAMRKLAKRREAASHKQQHIANMSNLRKAHEGPKARKEIHTPQEFSRLKHRKQLEMEQQKREFDLRVIQHQKAVLAAKAGHQTGQQNSAMSQFRNSVAGAPNGSSPNMTGVNSQAHMRGGLGDASRAVPQMHRMMNGQTNGVLPTSSQGVPHAPMQSNAQAQMPLQQRLASGQAPDPRVMQEVSRVQAQQQAYQQQIRQQSHPQSLGHAGSPNMQNHNAVSQNNAAILGPVQGRSSPSINGVPPPMGSSSSPRMTQPQALSSGMTPAINHISSQVKARHPQASQEQIDRMTTDQLYKMSEARNHAMQAAAGNANMNAVASNSGMGIQSHSPMPQAAMMVNGGSSVLNPAHYAQIMRSQQASQQRGANVGNGPNMNGNTLNGSSMSGGGKHGSRSVTPMIQRTSSGQGVPRPSQSPSARPVGLAQ